MIAIIFRRVSAEFGAAAMFMTIGYRSRDGAAHNGSLAPHLLLCGIGE
jgi:hypothetical protein